MDLLTVLKIVFYWNTEFHLCMTSLWLPSLCNRKLSIYDETVKHKIFCLACYREHVLSSTLTSLGKFGDSCSGVLANSCRTFPSSPALTMISTGGLGVMTRENIKHL